MYLDVMSIAKMLNYKKTLNNIITTIFGRKLPNFIENKDSNTYCVDNIFIKDSGTYVHVIGTHGSKLPTISGMVFPDFEIALVDFVNNNCNMHKFNIYSYLCSTIDSDKSNHFRWHHYIRYAIWLNLVKLYDW